MITQTKETQAQITPETAVSMLAEGNNRFLARMAEDRDLLQQVELTAGGQAPFAVVLSCIDSRVPAEMVFDQGIGDIFSARIAVGSFCVSRTTERLPRLSCWNCSGTWFCIYSTPNLELLNRRSIQRQYFVYE